MGSMDGCPSVVILCKLDIVVCSEDEIPVTCILTRVYNKDNYTYELNTLENGFESEDEAGHSLTHPSETGPEIGSLQISEATTEYVDTRLEKEIVEAEYIIIDERAAMTAMGLPTSFGSKRRSKKNGQKARIGKEDFATFVMSPLKEYYGIQSLESARPIIAKTGFFYKNRTRKTFLNQKNSDDQVDMDTSDASEGESLEIINDDIKSNSINENDKIDETTGILEDDAKLITSQVSEENSENLESSKDLKCVDIEVKTNDNCNVIQNESLQSRTNRENNCSDYASAKSQLEEEFEDIVTKVQKKKKRNRRKKNSYIPAEILQDKGLIKYYRKRYTLFSLYDNGIQLDREGWFSATPECIAKHTADRLRCDIVVDAFCGTGGNSIQFAKACKKVIAIDIDPVKIEMAKHNAGIYGVCDKIEFIIGDFVQLAPTLKADVVFLSPPWGGPNYKANTVYDLEKHLQPLPVSSLFTLALKITRNIAMYLPKNSNTKQLVILAGKGNRVELEQNFLYDRLTAITAYYGNLIHTYE